MNTQLIVVEKDFPGKVIQFDNSLDTRDQNVKITADGCTLSVAGLANNAKI